MAKKITLSCVGFLFSFLWRINKKTPKLFFGGGGEQHEAEKKTVTNNDDSISTHWRVSHIPTETLGGTMLRENLICVNSDFDRFFFQHTNCAASLTNEASNCSSVILSSCKARTVHRSSSVRCRDCSCCSSASLHCCSSNSMRCSAHCSAPSPSSSCIVCTAWSMRVLIGIECAILLRSSIDFKQHEMVRVSEACCVATTSRQLPSMLYRKYKRKSFAVSSSKEAGLRE